MSSETSTRLCSLGGRSFTDVLSNVVFLAPLRTPSELFGLLQCRLEAQKLTTLMHEFVHHQSLQSPVGIALCLLGFGSQRAGWVMNDTRQQYFVNLFSTRYFPFLVANLALRPLAEGLALFAEHDVYPPDAREVRSLLSLVTDLIGVGFYPRTLQSTLLFAKLQMARLAQDAERKADLLAGSFSASRGGYLLGYCMIKALWRRAVSHDKYFQDPDKFLLFAIGVLYGDYHQVSRLLDVADNESDFYPHDCSRELATNAIRSLNNFFDNPQLPTQRASIEALTRPSDRQGLDETNALSRCVSSPQDIETGIALLKKWTEWQREPESQLRGHVPPGLNAIQNEAWNGRHFFRIMSLPATWEMSGGLVRLIGDSFYLESQIQWLTEGSRRAGKGSLDVVFSYARLAYVVVLASDEEVGLLANFSRGTRSEDLEEDLASWRGLTAALDRDRELSEWLEETRLQIMPQPEWDKFENAILDSASNVYLDYLAPLLTVSREREFIAAVTEKGLRGIFEDSEAIRTLAICSALSASGPSLNQFRDGLSHFGLDMNSVLGMNRQYASRCQLNAISLAESRVDCLF